MREREKAAAGGRWGAEKTEEEGWMCCFLSKSAWIRAQIPFCTDWKNRAHLTQACTTRRNRVRVFQADWAGRKKNSAKSSWMRAVKNLHICAVCYSFNHTHLLQHGTFFSSESIWETASCHLFLCTPKERAELGGWISIACWICDPRGHGWKEMASQVKRKVHVESFQE